MPVVANLDRVQGTCLRCIHAAILLQDGRPPAEVAVEGGWSTPSQMRKHLSYHQQPEVAALVPRRCEVTNGSQGELGHISECPNCEDADWLLRGGADPRDVAHRVGFNNYRNMRRHLAWHRQRHLLRILDDWTAQRSYEEERETA